MPSVQLHRKTVESMLAKKLTTDQLKHAVSYLGTDLDDVTKTHIEVEIFPNRPDLLSEQGLGRNLAQLQGKTFQYKAQKSSYQVVIDPAVKKIRPLTRCVVVTDLHLTQDKLDQIIQMQEKLHITFGRNREKVAIGVYPLDAINFPITFTAKKPNEIMFTPLDGKQMNAEQLLTNHPTGKQYGHLLENKKVFPVFIDAKDTVLSVPPIINSEEAGRVTSATTSVFIECSGTHQQSLDQGIAILAAAFADMGGTLHQVSIKDTITVASPQFDGITFDVDFNQVNDLLGLNLSNKQITDCLTRMGHRVNKNKVTAPMYRADILHPVDFIEDVAIAYGYDKFTPQLATISTIGKQSEKEKLANKIIELLTGLGMQEVQTFVISPEASQTSKVLLDTPVVKLKNPETTEYNCLRHWLTSSLLETLQINTHNEYPQHICMTGRCALLDKEVKEYDSIGIALCDDKATFTTIKQIWQYLCEQLRLDIPLKELQHPTFIKGRAAQADDIVFFGEIHPQVIHNFNIEHPIVAMEIHLDRLYKRIYPGDVQ